MEKRVLIMQWDYTYDKESTWFDEDHGQEEYELKEGAVYPLPHIREKSLEIRSVTAEDGVVRAEVYTDCKTYMVVSGEAPVTAYASYSYSAAGDSVSQSLCLKLSIV